MKSKYQTSVFSDVINVNPRRVLTKGKIAKYVSMKDLLVGNKEIQNLILKEYKGGSRFKNGDTLFARITPCLENGKTAFVDVINEDEIVFGSTEFIVFSAKEGKTTPQFVYYLSRSDFVRDPAIKSMTGSSGRQRVINSIFDQIKVPIPSIEEQEKIGNFLKAFDDKIALNSSLNSILEDLGEVLFKRWFVEFEFPGEEGKPYKSNGGPMNQTSLGSIPENWILCKINDLCSSISNGGTPNRRVKEYWENGTINWYKTGELIDLPLIGSEERINKIGLKKSSAKLWPLNTILIALYASPTVGRLGILKTEATANQACSALIAKKEIGYSYIYYLLKNEQLYFRNIAIGAAQQNISQKLVKEHQVIKPDLSTLSKFSQIIEPFIDKITNNLNENHYLSELRDILLTRLMSGEINVNV